MFNFDARNCLDIKIAKKSLTGSNMIKYWIPAWHQKHPVEVVFLLILCDKRVTPDSQTLRDLI